jgi:hypothetical protein
MRAFLIAIGVMAVLAGPALAQEEQKLTEKAKKAVDAVKADMDKRKAQGAIILWKEEKGLAKTFPDYDFVVARFRQFPVARQLPEGLSAANVFAVKDGKLQHLKDVKALQKFFKEHESPVKGEAQAKDAMTSWLALSQEYHQDGMFRFDILEKEYSVENAGKTIRGRAIVMQGGNGELAVTLTFDEGKLNQVKESAKIQAGPRPICQATKLLDADPIVRKMAEQDILIMGKAARAYLMEQRAQASPQLQAAIDRIWRLIQQRGN